MDAVPDRIVALPARKRIALVAHDHEKEHVLEWAREHRAVLAEHGGRPVVIEQGNLVAAAFHPELVGEARLHAYVLGKV
mgnify:CR=1 FL=1